MRGLSSPVLMRFKPAFVPGMDLLLGRQVSTVCCTGDVQHIAPRRQFLVLCTARFCDAPAVDRF
jgi:hypothetical protein